MVSIDDFLRGPYQTAVGRAEVLTEVRIPVRATTVSAISYTATRLGASVPPRPVRLSDG